MNYLRPAVIGLLALVALLALFAQGEPAYAATITVNSTADVIADDGVCTLREAITGANTDTASGAMGGECTAGSGADTITVPAGTYTLSIAGANEDAAATGDLDITDGLAITGAGAGSSIIDGGGIDRVFHITVVTPGGVAATVEISGLTIRNGALSEGNGGGIGNLGDLTLTDVTVSANSAQEGGGGISNRQGGTVSLINSTVSGNSAEGGGGIWNSQGGTVSLINSTVSGNSAEGGGGIWNSQGGTVSLINSTVSGNSAFGEGGIASQGPLTLDNSTVSGNSAFSGGGITIFGTACATASVTNSTVSGNSATAGSGGGLSSDGCGNLILTNSTVSGNTASDGGGGIANGALASTATLKNTIVANSTAGGDCSGTITSDGYNLDSDGTCSFTATGDLQNTDPLLGPLADNGGPTFTHALLAGSPAIDAGSPDCPPPAIDQRGVARPQGTGCDIGAYEHAPTITVTTTDDELNSDGDCSLREAIQAANTDAAVDACSAGSGADTVEVPAGTYTLSIAGANEDANATGAPPPPLSTAPLSTGCFISIRSALALL